ncbi:hypothetical protein BDV27DRAFT_128379 [Aspergillus caelatus]|uniref:Uncharacterized protein n=1 Tax=Aspergillus caelatus TaxID=61420 RepID=A0A5N7A4U4_9EURO|nr:uncharacterized protein BDV27DRAFT_128379 [Aspergillus caelatus]KAE8364448.1 hypothetical protein BDV27DRAFT_128379 [Aspergillus caelatus]
MQPPTILLLGTFDTKTPELTYTYHTLLTQTPQPNILVLDVSRQPPKPPPTPTDLKINYTIPQKDLPAPRAEYIKAASDHATTIVADLYKENKIHGIISIGGSCGTNIATAAMRNALPVGFPKLMVSTMASGDVKPYVEETDVTMMYSVVDIAGRNWILEGILRNAACAVFGMARGYLDSLVRAKSQGQGDGGDGGSQGKKRVGITMFGVTTPGVDRIRAHLEDVYGFEVYVFHATGAGGKAMERLIREGQLDAVVDLTTSEVVDEVMGGVLSAGPERLAAAARAGIPQVVSVGACDMVNFGPRNTIPERYAGRLIYEHNPTVTLVRPNAEETVEVARFIAEKLRTCAVKPELICLMLPTGGISMIDTPGQPFFDPEVDEVLFSTLEEELKGTGISIVRDPRAINDPEFAVSVADMLGDLIKSL